MPPIQKMNWTHYFVQSYTTVLNRESRKHDSYGGKYW
jgi:hypothetical protein